MTKKILVVDDDRTATTLVSFLLKTNDYDVASASNGKEGLEKAVSGKPDLIVLDIMMPQMDGYTFLQELKKKNNLQNIKTPPIIMLTSKDKMETTFRLEGVADYFVKPLDTEKFLKKVQQVCPAADK